MSDSSENRRNSEILGGFICHAEEERCLKIGERVMPLCARCFGFYSGLFPGFLFLFFYNILIQKLGELPPEMVLLSILAMIPFSADGISQELTERESSNRLRLITGGLLGIFIGIDISWILLMTFF